MKTKKPPVGKKKNKSEVPVIQLVPPVLFIRKKKRTLVMRAIRKLFGGLLPKRTLRKVISKGPYAQSKKVYVN